MLSTSISRTGEVWWRDLQVTLPDWRCCWEDLTAAASRSYGLNLRFCVVTLTSWASNSATCYFFQRALPLPPIPTHPYSRGLDLPLALPAICSETVGWAASWPCTIQYSLDVTMMLCKLVFGDGKVLALKSSCDELLDYSVATLDASNLINEAPQ